MITCLTWFSQAAEEERIHDERSKAELRARAELVLEHARKQREHEAAEQRRLQELFEAELQAARAKRLTELMVRTSVADLRCSVMLIAVLSHAACPPAVSA